MKSCLPLDLLRFDEYIFQYPISRLFSLLYKDNYLSKIVYVQIFGDSNRTPTGL